MNILHMKYAVDVATFGSINKASESLLVAPANISRSIKELEADLGITIFDRSAKGMKLTSDGEAFVGYARKVLGMIGEIEDMYKKGEPLKYRFSVSVPRASYISDAFARFSGYIGCPDYEVFYKETNSERTIENVLSGDYNLGIVRYAVNYDRYFTERLEEKGLAHEILTDFKYVLVMSKKGPLASKKTVNSSDLNSLIEIAHADPYVPSLPLAAVKREELSDEIRRRIFVFERGSQFELLSENHDTYMWVSPLPASVLERFGLVQKPCADNDRIYRDILIYHRDYRKTDLDMRFIEEVKKSIELIF